MASQIPIPVMRVSGTFALLIFLYVFVTFGALHLFAISKYGSSTKVGKVIIGLGF